MARDVTDDGCFVVCSLLREDCFQGCHRIDAKNA